jgi:hypothetical protein
MKTQEEKQKIEREIEESCNKISNKIINKEPTLVKSFIGGKYSFVKSYISKGNSIVKAKGTMFDITSEINNLISQAKLLGFNLAKECVLEDVREIIDKLEETRSKEDNHLAMIHFGNEFSTNSIKALKEKLKQKIEELR